MPHKHGQSRYLQSGISLVELMVALVIGLVATLVVMQVFSAFEGQKRTTSGNADAQTNGTVALFAISKNIQRAGFGLFPAEDSAYECADAALTPIEITEGGANPDTIRIRYGTSQYGGAPTTVISPSAAMTITNKKNENVTGDNVTTSVITVRNNLGCQAGDTAVLIDGGACQTSQVIDTSAKVNGDADYSRILLNTTGVTNGTTISCLGNWQQAEFRIDPATGSSLQLNGTDFTNGIVNLQAEYGISLSANDNKIDSWVQAKNEWQNVSAISPNDRNRIKAIRLSLVSRNALSERDNVTESPADYGVADSVENKKFRYRRFETTIPLRNVIWAKATFQ